MLLAVVWPGGAVTVHKKKPVVAAKKRAVAKRVAAKKRRVPARVAPNVPQKFVTEPVQTELVACSMKDRPGAESGLCLSCAEQALSTAHAFTGLRYKRGGTNPDIGFDCSGFVRHVFVNSCGRELPRTAREQFAMGEPVAREELQRGDLVFFSGRAGWHVGIYTGNDSFIHSPNRRDSIRVTSLEAPYWKKLYKGARRVTTDIAPMVASEAATLPTNE